MTDQQLLNLKPPAIVQSPLIPDQLPLISYQIMKQFQHIPIPLLSTHSLDILQSYLLTLQQNYLVGGISVPISGQHTLSTLHPLWKHLFAYISETGFNKPLFIQGELSPGDLNSQTIEKLVYNMMVPPFTGVTFTINLQEGESILEQIAPLCHELNQHGFGLIFNIHHHIPKDTESFEQFFRKMISLRITPDGVAMPHHYPLEQYLQKKLGITVVQRDLSAQRQSAKTVYLIDEQTIPKTFQKKFQESFYYFRTLFRQLQITHTLGEFVTALNQSKL